MTSGSALTHRVKLPAAPAGAIDHPEITHRRVESGPIPWMSLR